MNYIGIKLYELRELNQSRVVLYISGCPHNCMFCDNEIKNADAGSLFTLDSMVDILDELDKLDQPIFSMVGGDPFSDVNINVIKELLVMIYRKFEFDGRSVHVTANTIRPIEDIASTPTGKFVLRYVNELIYHDTYYSDGENCLAIGSTHDSINVQEYMAKKK